MYAIDNEMMGMEENPEKKKDKIEQKKNPWDKRNAG